MKPAKLALLGLAGLAGLAYSGAVFAGGDSDASDLFNIDLGDFMGEHKNLTAFKAMIREAETGFKNGDERQYRTLFGSTPRIPVLFNGFADHPRIAKTFKDKNGVTQWTSAAGGYQAMAISKTANGMTRVDTWDRIKRKLGLPDFTPKSQEKFADELLRSIGAMPYILSGNFEAAIKKSSGTWASLPGANYAQPTKQISYLLSLYKSYGGATA
jgi:muramidase (phage lysozyme)